MDKVYFYANFLSGTVSASILLASQIFPPDERRIASGWERTRGYLSDGNTQLRSKVEMIGTVSLCLHDPYDHYFLYQHRKQ
jgi:hypothetical protein